MTTRAGFTCTWAPAETTRRELDGRAPALERWRPVILADPAIWVRITRDGPRPLAGLAWDHFRQ